MTRIMMRRGLSQNVPAMAKGDRGLDLDKAQIRVGNGTANPGVLAYVGGNISWQVWLSGKLVYITPSHITWQELYGRKELAEGEMFYVTDLDWVFFIREGVPVPLKRQTKETSVPPTIESIHAIVNNMVLNAWLAKKPGDPPHLDWVKSYLDGLKESGVFADWMLDHVDQLDTYCTYYIRWTDKQFYRFDYYNCEGGGLKAGPLAASKGPISDKAA